MVPTPQGWSLQPCDSPMGSIKPPYQQASPGLWLQKLFLNRMDPHPRPMHAKEFRPCLKWALTCETG